jgi:hypothetical protein
VCLVPYVWNAITLVCDLDCTTDPMYNEDGAASVGECACLGDGEWSTENFKCQVNCANDEYNNSNTDSPSPAGACNCLGATEWNSEEFKCKLDCTNDDHNNN